MTSFSLFSFRLFQNWVNTRGKCWEVRGPWIMAPQLSSRMTVLGLISPRQGMRRVTLPTTSQVGWEHRVR